MVTVSEVYSAAMGLQANERAEIAHRLLLSLEPAGLDADADQAWAEEIRRRLRAIREGHVSLRDWNESLAEIRNTITLKDGK